MKQMGCESVTLPTGLWRQRGPGVRMYFGKRTGLMFPPQQRLGLNDRATAVERSQFAFATVGQRDEGSCSSRSGTARSLRSEMEMLDVAKGKRQLSTTRAVAQAFNRRFSCC